MPVFRLDSDTAAGRGAHAAHPGRASARPPSGVLVGTQMVAKGHDFPEVTLSAILDADATLRFPDFRAEERTFAMVAQLAGRSGRGAGRGEGDRADAGAPRRPASSTPPATTPPGSWPASSSAAACCATRPSPTWRGSGSPPRAEERLDVAAARLAAELRRRFPRDTELLGPAPMFRVRSRHRRRLLIKASDREGTVAAIRSVVERLAAERALRDVAIGVDVDPQ